jgi:hypothetical protein
MKPVILVPGFGGSVLVKRGSELYKPHPFAKKILDNRWINLKTLAAPPSGRWYEDMYYNIATKDDDKGLQRITGLTNVSPDIVPYDFGGTKGIKDLIPEFHYLGASYKHKLNSVFYYRYFHNICDELYKIGYKDHETLYGLPYDFRLVLDPAYREGLFDKMGQTLEESVKVTGDKAIIVTHSMGGLLLKWFLTTRPYYQSLVDRWVSISTPFGGSHYSLRVALCGDHYTPLFKNTVKDELARNTGLIMCFPNSLAFHPEEPLASVIEGFDAIKSGDLHAHITVQNYETLAKHGCLQFKMWRDLYKPYLGIIEQPISVPTHVVISSNENTRGRFTMRTIGSEPLDEIMIKGDGIVSEKSLRMFERIIHARDIRETVLTNGNHTSPLIDRSVIKLIRAYAQGRK